MDAPQVGLITFGDARQHEWNKVFGPLTVPRHAQAIEYLSSLPIVLHASPQVARQKDEIDAQVDQLRQAGVEVLVAHTPCWTSPNLVVRGVQRLGLPTLLLSNKSPSTHGLVGFLGAAGALDQIGYRFWRVREDFESGETLAGQLLPVIRAASAVRRLKGRVFGLFGGRSLGIDTGSFDPMQWRAVFGVDVEQIDQLEIIRQADQISDEQAQQMTGWLKRSVGRVDLGQGGLTEEKLAFQARCYLATRQIIAEKGLDFVAIQCMPDLTNHFVPQCISAALLPGPYDADGRKEPVSMACEADGDGALTMEMLKLVSGGQPVLFGDLSYINEQRRILYIPNCGAMCSWYAARSDDPAENLRHVELRPAIRPGGGAIAYFTAAPGPVTLARLFRKSGRYQMAIITGQAVSLEPAELEAFVQARGAHQLPTAFVQVGADLERLLQVYGSNHISGVAGLYQEELVRLCELLNVEPLVF
jgi:L-fucose isomerase